MAFAWDDSRRAFTDAAEWFVRTAALVGDRWDGPGLGEWDVRARHTSRSLLTVEAYLARPATSVEVNSAADYFQALRGAATEALRLVTDLAVADDVAGVLLLAATGRRGLPAGFSVL